MNKNPLISVITVCYNSERTIERTIKSVLQQKFNDYEYIIVDGASTDGTLDIIKRYEPLFEGRMHWKSEPDKGIYNAFNKGIMRSQGVLTWLVNSDDYIEPNALEIIKEEYSKYDKENYPVISFAANYVDKDGKLLSHLFFNTRTANLAAKMYESGMVHPATIIPKKVYSNFELYDEDFKMSGDLNWFLRSRKYNVAMEFKDIVITNMANTGISATRTENFHIIEQKLYFNKNYPTKIGKYIRYLCWYAIFSINSFRSILIKKTNLKKKF